MSVVEKLGLFVGTLSRRDATVDLLVAAAEALAVEIDSAMVPDDKGRTKSAAAPVRELRATVDDLVVKGGVGDGRVGETDWTDPANVVSIGAARVGVAKVRNAPKRKQGDIRG